MINFNEVLVSGRLTAKPESVLTKSGHHLTKFTIANNDPYKREDGSWSNHVNWIRVTKFGMLEDYMNEKLDKGVPVYVKGKFRVSSGLNKEGKKADYCEVIASRIYTDNKKSETLSQKELDDDLAVFDENSFVID